VNLNIDIIKFQMAFDCAVSVGLLSVWLHFLNRKRYNYPDETGNVFAGANSWVDFFGEF
jgi:hypothetical protein